MIPELRVNSDLLYGKIPRESYAKLYYDTDGISRVIQHSILLMPKSARENKPSLS